MSDTKESLDLKTFKFPEAKAFSSFGTIPELLKEAKKRNFYGGNSPYNKAFSTLFFRGGKVEFKKDLDDKWVNPMWAYCRALMASFEPSHEDKDAVCAMLLSELIEPEIKSK